MGNADSKASFRQALLQLTSKSQASTMQSLLLAIFMHTFHLDIMLQFHIAYFCECTWNQKSWCQPIYMSLRVAGLTLHNRSTHVPIFVCLILCFSLLSPSHPTHLPYTLQLYEDSSTQAGFPLFWLLVRLLKHAITLKVVHMFSPNPSME